MKNKQVIIFLIVLFGLIFIVSAIEFTPQGDIQLHSVFDILNIKNSNQTGNATFSGAFVNITGTLYSGIINSLGNNISADYFQGNLDWTNLTNYPVACPSNTYLTQLGDSVTCTAVTQIDNNLVINGNVTIIGNLTISDS